MSSSANPYRRAFRPGPRDTVLAGPHDHWVVLPLMRATGRRRREAMLAGSSLSDVSHPFERDAGIPSLPGWECIPTPGHTPGHVSFFRASDRVFDRGRRHRDPDAQLLGGSAAAAARRVGATAVHELELAGDQGVGREARAARAERAGWRPRHAHDLRRSRGCVAGLRRSVLRLRHDRSPRAGHRAAPGHTRNRGTCSRISRRDRPPCQESSNDRVSRVVNGGTGSPDQPACRRQSSVASTGPSFQGRSSRRYGPRRMLWLTLRNEGC